MSALGLTFQEAQKRKETYGKNILPETSPPSGFSVFISQLKSPLVYVLLVAAGVTFFLKEYSDTVIISLAVVLNTVLGFFQERKAGRALEALKKLLHPTVLVIRDGKEQKIDSKDLVPGDLVILNQGDKIPADGKLIFSNRLLISEAILTGESVPVAKKEGQEVYMGTVISSGRASLVVEQTGANTKMGNIAQGVQELDEDTPLRYQLGKFSKQLAFLVFGLLVLVFGIGLIAGTPIAELFITSVALAVSSIPEGLLIALTVILAIGMQRILKEKGLVRHLVSAETLGGVTTICTDKTGTLTQGKMQVVEIIGDESALTKQVLLANDRDDPIVLAAWEWGLTKQEDPVKLAKAQACIDSIPFSSEKREFLSLHLCSNSENIYFVNGAPETILERCVLSVDEKSYLLEQIHKLSSEGKRLLGFAQKKVSGSVTVADHKDVKDNLTWIGLLAFNDPVRPDIKRSLQKTREAGIKLIVITGDYSETALSVMRELNINIESDAVMLGNELEGYSVQELAARLKGSIGTKLFARTTPNQKLKIIEALKMNGEVVAMMGDGVNDAPALSKADIGIVVGDASDVAKESADLVLLDSSFATIVSAIEEGRGIFDNIRKVLLYLLSDAFEGIAAVVLTLLFRLPLPVSASQILWINLVSDGFPNLALTVDPKISGIMQKSPRSPFEPLVAPWMRYLIFIISVLSGGIAFGYFFYIYKTTGDVVLARSVVFASLGINTLTYVFSVRSLGAPFWKESVFKNKLLIVAVLAGVFLQVLPFLVSGLRDFFNIVPIGNYWYFIVVSSIVMFFVVEVSKWIFRKWLRV